MKIPFHSELFSHVSQSAPCVAGQDQCTCRDGYTLDSDSSTCLDVDECKTNQSGCDPTRGICVNIVGSFSCSCADGYSLGQNYECKGQ